METDDCSEDKVLDSDSGIENMETEESQEPTAESLSNKQSAAVVEVLRLDQEREVCISKILNAAWTDQCKGSTLVKETAADYINNPDLDVEDLISKVIVEILFMYFDGTLTKSSSSLEMFPDTNVVTSGASSSKTTAEPKSEKSSEAGSSEAATKQEGGMDTQEPNCPKPALISFSLPRVAALDYLIRCYDLGRCELSYYEGSKRVHAPEMITTIQMLRSQLIYHSILILDGTIRPKANPNQLIERSPLLQLMYEKSAEHDFLVDLISETHKTPATFNKVFKPLLKDIFRDMQMAVASKDLNYHPIMKLNELTEITVENNVRPICSLVAKLYNFFPVLATQFPGREISKVSYLGPFLSLSIFWEENPKWVEHNLTSNSTTDLDYHPVQSDLACIRSYLHDIFHALLKNMESRNSVLMYFSALLK